MADAGGGGVVYTHKEVLILFVDFFLSVSEAERTARCNGKMWARRHYLVDTPPSLPQHRVTPLGPVLSQKHEYVSGFLAWCKRLSAKLLPFSARHTAFSMMM
jgi:hypothetical protein